MSGESRLTALGGAPLVGSRLVRILYLDESGIGKISKDPHLVVAGVLIHGDTHWRGMSEHLRGLLEDAVPAGEPTPSHLHAKDIFHGSGEFPRDRWSETVRHRLLDKVADVPWLFGVPIMWGLVDRAPHAKEDPESSPLQHLIDAYSIAALTCFMQAEWFMRNRVGPDELASVVLERNGALQKRIPEVFSGAKAQSVLEASDKGDVGAAHILPLTRLIDAPSYQDKTAASILQMADFVAFTFKRAVAMKPGYERFAKPLSRTCLTWNPGKVPPIHAPSWGERPSTKGFLTFQAQR